MKQLYVLMAIIITTNAFASEEFGVELFKNALNINLDWYQKKHLYEKTIGYMSTCNHLDKVIGKEVLVKDEEEALLLLTQGNYLKLSFGKTKPKFPLRTEAQEVSVIYVGVRNDGLPSLITKNSGDIQLYAKCQGHYAILNFSCDSTLSNLLEFNINQKLCSSLKQ